MEMTVLLGAADPGWEPCLDEVARELAVVLGFDIVRAPSGEEMFLGGDDSVRVWLTSEPQEDEPHHSHPFILDFTTNEPGMPYAQSLFDRLANLGRYRLVLVIDHDCVRSTHFPCEDW
ncbi:hypothetical protein [Micromonospora deserti]|uniref:Uncharacterized protein n=1 Tax=Micromonospora deserti TaxID=2070366 RepID=A0A2W2CED6_9ACTN|nr:hypothetical protein [Micromonospora deserti]PZF86599.1 hypothetical protein C1I99_28760 [Micromonospora deserti]